MKEQLKAHFIKLIAWLDAKALRERVLVASLIFISMALLLYVSMIDPLIKESKKTKIQITSMQGQLAEQKTQLSLVEQQAHIDPNQPLRIEKESVMSAIKMVDKKLSELTVAFIPPEQMATLLKQVLTKETQLKLIKIESESAEPVEEGPEHMKQEADKATQKVLSLYKHGLVMELEGPYLDTIDYLKALESLPWHFLWHQVKYEVVEYPRGRITIKLYTLSTDEEWLGV